MFRLWLYPILLASPLSEEQRDERVPWSTPYLTLLQMRDDLHREPSLHGYGGASANRFPDSPKPGAVRREAMSRV